MTNSSGQTFTQYNLKEILETSNCPACGYYIAVAFYDGGQEPLTTLAWPSSKEEAQAMKRLPLTFYRCVDCGHVFNINFNYDDVPYSEKPNLMFNKGTLWTDHLKRIEQSILEYLPERPLVIEIGCGDGHLLHSLAEKRPQGRFIGFDPNAYAHTNNGQIEVVHSLFDPTIHLAEYKPDMIISRHVLEHLMNPLGFVQTVAFSVNWYDFQTYLFIEVPCIDRVFLTGRCTDFFYEHNSHFTTVSLTRMLTRCATRLELVERGYNDEVVYGIARLGAKTEQSIFSQEAMAFRERTSQATETICQQLDELFQSGRKSAFWGGTGKAAAFINRYQVDADRFPIVVDSDLDKVGTFVPGYGQEIRSPEYLLDNSVDTIVISTQWRASDIVLEIQRRGITYQNILLEHEGRLVDYFADAHPYNIVDA